MVWSLYDPDNLRSALEPVLVGLSAAGVIDRAINPRRHKIEYSQEVSRARPGIEIAVDLLP